MAVNNERGASGALFERMAEASAAVRSAWITGSTLGKSNVGCLGETSRERVSLKRRKVSTLTDSW
jgi:hypothetical protein